MVTNHEDHTQLTEGKSLHCNVFALTRLGIEPEALAVLTVHVLGIIIIIY